MDKNLVLVSVAIIFREGKRKREWLITKQTESSDWELPRILVRKGESSARAALRMAGEQLGMSTKVLEEAGRAGGVTSVNDKAFPQRQLYYLMVQKAATGEVIGFAKHAWLEYARAVRNLSSKRDRQMIKAARKELKAWLKREQKEEGN
jgi:ADP-ribose pyrophosphatase YjhB (NUDIX family)